MARIRKRWEKQKETGIKHNKGKLTGRNQRKISRGIEQKKKEKKKEKNKKKIKKKKKKKKKEKKKQESDQTANNIVEITKNEIIISFRKSEKEKKVR